MADYFSEDVLLPDGWARDVRIQVSNGGTIDSVRPNQSPENSIRLSGPLIPGMADVHSHSFQRAMAGLTERTLSADDDFWSWRKVMYGFALRLTPEDLHAIAAQLFVELLRHGYTSVGEFHYLHNQPGGAPYAAPAEMSTQVAGAARRMGIAITLLPVLYAFGGFGGQPLGGSQNRFRGAVGDVLRIAEDVRAQFVGDPCVSIGIAPHSLRAVNLSVLEEAESGLREIDAKAPIHIHIAEQTKEVDDCLTWSNQRPIEWLLDHMPVDDRWCLIHATHAQDSELAKLAVSGATVGLCPTTEANLGDGIFPLDGFDARGGGFGVGSDSNVSVSPVEELRWLEYGQRLRSGRRNVFAAAGQSSVGAALWRAAAEGGAKALGQPAGAIAAGRRADILVLDGSSPNLVAKAGDDLIDAFIFSGNDNAVKHVMVGGRWVVRDGRHVEQERVLTSFQQVLRKLAAA